jgi:hydrogenase/urease accessory protein HupE
LNRSVVWLFLVVLAAALALSRPAGAHAVGLSQGEYQIDGATVHAALTFSGAELAAALPALDADGQGHAVVDRTAVLADGSPCAARFDEAAVTASDAVRILATFSCPAEVRLLTIDASFVDLFAAGHRHIGTVGTVGTGDTFILVAARRTVSVDLAARRAPGTAPRTSFSSMVWTGVQHIWTGYDHLAFLLALVLVGGRARSLVGTVSAFTVAHSITLALAVLHVVTPRASIVEPGIALSIACVGVENLWRRGQEVRGRWRITFLFGLLHGFGFASALTELDLPRERVASALLAFNVGVELGQLAVLAVVLPPIVLLRRRAAFRTWGVGALSAALAVAGCVWFVVRIQG